MLRILFYCHNLFGLGHISRSLRIAEAALETGRCECRLITGCRFLKQLVVDPRVQVQQLPPVQLDAAGRIVPLETGEVEGDVVRYRARQIEDFCRSWKPHVVVVDHHPLGLGGELVDVLTAARRERWPTHFIWGIPYSEGAIATTARRPRNPLLREAIEHYQSAMAYAEEAWDDILGAYRDLGLPARRAYVGVVAARPLAPRRGEILRLVGLSGGGQAGTRLFTRVLEAVHRLPQAEGLHLRFVAGPFGSCSELESLAGGRPVEIWPEASAERAVQDASVVVSRTGYNTAFSLIQTDLPLVLVPQQMQHGDQFPRARRMAELPGVWLVDEEQPAFVAELAGALAQALATPPPVARTLPFRVDGAARASAWILDAATEASASGGP